MKLNIAYLQARLLKQVCGLSMHAPAILDPKNLSALGIALCFAIDENVASAHIVTVTVSNKPVLPVQQRHSTMLTSED